MIPQSFRQELLSRIDVVEVVGRYVKLKKSGANFMGLCPFHNEKSPSFSVSPSRQFYHCFGCGKSGDAVGFLMDYQSLGFVDAIKSLANDCGLTVPEHQLSSEEAAWQKEQKSHHAQLTDVLEKAAKFFQANLKESKTAVAYFKGRGVSGVVAAKFGLGYALNEWDGLKKSGIESEASLLVAAGLVVVNEGDLNNEKRYDRFRHRVMFPIRNIKGECIGFGGRVLNDDKPKYLNSPETDVFSKGKELYGLYEAQEAIRKKGQVLVTEGYMDVVALAQHGILNVVATLGTACTENQIQKLLRITDVVIFGFDGDGAGRRAARKALETALPFATDSRQLKFLFFPPEHDPDSFIRQYGAGALKTVMDEAMPLSQFLIQSAKEGCDVATMEGRSNFATHAKSLWHQLPEGTFKLQLQSEIAKMVQLSTDELKQVWVTQENWEVQKKSPSQQMAKKNDHGIKRSVKKGPPQWGGWPFDQAPPSTARSQYLAQLRFGSKPVTRADRVMRLLLANSALWLKLSSEEHGLLCGLPAPLGEFFHWFEALLHEHGVLSWGSLEQELCLHVAYQSYANHLIEKDPVPATVGEEAEAELRDLIDRMMVEQLKREETQAIAKGSQDQEALEHYKALFKRRQALEAQLSK